MAFCERWIIAILRAGSKIALDSRLCCLLCYHKLCKDILQVEEERMPKTDTLIKVGDRAPDFKLKNYDGTEYTLKGLVKDSNVFLLFFRGTW